MEELQVEFLYSLLVLVVVVEVELLGRIGGVSILIADGRGGGGAPYPNSC